MTTFLKAIGAALPCGTHTVGDVADYYQLCIMCHFLCISPEIDHNDIKPPRNSNVTHIFGRKEYYIVWKVLTHPFYVWGFGRFLPICVCFLLDMDKNIDLYLTFKSKPFVVIETENYSFVLDHVQNLEACFEEHLSDQNRRQRCQEAPHSDLS